MKKIQLFIIFATSLLVFSSCGFMKVVKGAQIASKTEFDDGHIFGAIFWGIFMVCGVIYGLWCYYKNNKK